MDTLDGYGLSARALRLAYLGFLLIWFLIALLLIRLVISGVSKTDTVIAQNNQAQNTTDILAAASSGLPDMAEVMRWGYDGRGVKVDSNKLHQVHQEEYDDGFQNNDFNKYVSDRISMRRPLPDVRHGECRKLGEGLGSLPNASVVIVFQDEAWTTLLRTVYSVVDRSPPEYIREIILVDDGSTLEVLQYPKLEHYLSMLKKVRIIRLPMQHGIVKARTLGAKAASGDVVIFLQSRCECTVGWLTPLLARIALNISGIAIPVIDTIDLDTFGYTPQTLNMTSVGSFTWELKTKRRHLTIPVSAGSFTVRSPVITDGIFAVNRKYFFQLGGFDNSLLSEESANIEFSFRAWLCGGGITRVLCSHVGYVFPRMNSRFNNPIGADTLSDRVRIAKAWLSGYQDFVFERFPTIPDQASETGSQVGIQSNLHRNLACHSFSWFLQNVEPTKFLQGTIIRRGTLIHIITNETVKALAEKENIIILQEWYVTPFSIWYLMDTGELKNEDNMCVVLVNAPLEDHQGTHSEQAHHWQKPVVSQLESSDSPAHPYLPGYPFQDLQTENREEEILFRDLVNSVPYGFEQKSIDERKIQTLQHQNQQESKQVAGDADETQLRRKPQQNEDLEDLTHSNQDSEPISHDNLKPYYSQSQTRRFGETRPLSDNLDGRTPENVLNTHNLNLNLSQTPKSKHTLLQDIINQAYTKVGKMPWKMESPPNENRQNLDVTKPLLGAIFLRDKYVQKPSQLPLHLSMTPSLPFSQTLILKEVVLKSCDHINKGDQWSLTVHDTLRHVTSGLCMEVRKASSGNYTFQMVRCDDSAEEQKWAFSNRLSPR